MKLLKIIPLSLALMMAACGGNTTPSSSSPVEPSSEAESSDIDLFGFELKKDSDNVTSGTYNLADQITLKGGTQLSNLSFASSNEEVCTVSDGGIITRVSYGSAQIVIKRKDYSIFTKTFSINFLPDSSAYLGKYDSHMAEAEGHTDDQVVVTIELKNDNKFTINYTTGWLSAGSGESVTNYHIESAIAAEGTYEIESLIRFTVTSTSFPFKKTFSGIFIFDSDNTTIKAKVPVAAEKTSNMTYFEKVVA